MASVRVASSVLDLLLSEARASLFTECCGLLAGRDGVITHLFPAANARDSATEYEIAPDDLFRLFRDIRDAHLEHLGIYHSHLSTDNSPSPSDIAQAFYPGAAYFIVTPRENVLRPVRAFQIIDGVVSELTIEPV
jgi:proteasome lid subunit RPN8/RPN11